MKVWSEGVLNHRSDERGVHHWVLNDPARFNVLSDEMLAALEQATAAVAADEAARNARLRICATCQCPRIHEGKRCVTSWRSNGGPGWRRLILT